MYMIDKQKTLFLTKQGIKVIKEAKPINLKSLSSKIKETKNGTGGAFFTYQNGNSKTLNNSYPVAHHIYFKVHEFGPSSSTPRNLSQGKSWIRAKRVH